MNKKNSSWLIMSLLIIFALLLSACGGATPTAEAPKAEAPAAEQPAAEAPTAEAPAGDMNQVEVFSWWTGGGEAAGLEAMIEVFAAQVPGH